MPLVDFTRRLTEKRKVCMADLMEVFGNSRVIGQVFYLHTFKVWKSIKEMKEGVLSCSRDVVSKERSGSESSI